MPNFRQQKNRTFSVQIKCLDAELEFDLDKKSLGRDLLELVCRTLGIRETWYFGLQYKDTKEIVGWLKMDKLVREHSVERQSKLSLLFLVKFYPEEVAEELIQEITQHLFFLQVNRAILAMDIYCPPEASVLLASYAVQVKFGDYDENTYKPGMLATENLLPQRVIDQYQMTLEMWEDRIKVWYADHRGMTRDEAEMEYLKIAQDLDMYGVNYFLIHNKKDTTLWLGVTALGLNIYERENKLQPKMTFTWSEIRDISFEDKKFIIKVVDKNSPNFVFFSKKTRINKVILDLCVGNHSLFMRRRMPDTIEVQQMKTSAKEDKQRRIVQRNRLAHEKQLREECEKQKLMLEQQLAQAHEEIRLANEALKRSEETAELLAEKSRIAEEEAMLLGKKATDAEQEIARIRLSAMRTEEEKASLERKTHEAELLTVRLVEESERRVAEANRLKDELMKARLAEKQAKEKLLDFISHVPSPVTNSNLNAVSSTAIAPLSPISSIYGTNNNTNNNIVNGNQQQSKESQMLPTRISVSNLVQPEDEQSILSTQSNCDVEQLSLAIEKERIEYLKKSKHLLSKLENLRSEIEVLKVDEKWTDFDNLYESQIKLGENKYSTLHKVKSGSAKQRVAFFEEL